MIVEIGKTIQKLLALLAALGALNQSAPADLSGAEQAQFPYYAALLPEESRYGDGYYLGENALILVEQHEAGNREFGSAYILADLYVPDVHMLRTWYMDDPQSGLRGAADISTLGTVLHAALAVNGDFYPAQGVTAVRNGTVINSCVSSYDLCVLYEDGSMRTFPYRSLATQGDVNTALENAWQAWSFGPALLNEDGSPVSDFSGRIVDHLTDLHARTAIGYYGPGHYCLLNITGYRQQSPGVTLEAMSSFFSALGCSQAYNLDGGNSSHIWFQGRERGYPCEKKDLPDIIYLEDLTRAG